MSFAIDMTLRGFSMVPHLGWTQDVDTTVAEDKGAKLYWLSESRKGRKGRKCNNTPNLRQGIDKVNSYDIGSVGACSCNFDSSTVSVMLKLEPGDNPLQMAEKVDIECPLYNPTWSSLHPKSMVFKIAR